MKKLVWPNVMFWQMPESEKPVTDFVPAKGWLDTLCGLLPCVVENVFSLVETRKCMVRVRLTADRGAFKKGEVLEEPLYYFVRPTGATTCRAIPPYTVK